jgi:hypothetical protein
MFALVTRQGKSSIVTTDSRFLTVAAARSVEVVLAHVWMYV